MDACVLEEILHTQPDGRLCYNYRKGAFAPRLLSRLVGDGCRLSAVKASRFAPLLAQDSVAPALSAAGDGWLRPDMLAACEPVSPLPFTLSLAEWSSTPRTYRHRQMSRPGRGLVLQLNFTGAHDDQLQSTLRPGRARPFCYWKHPINRHGMNTLAWARIDLDLDTGEALIEELQTDWVRFAASFHDRAKQDGSARLDGRKIPLERVGRYVTRVLRPYARIWDEAMLMAAIGFLHDDVGIRRIFLHDHDSGARLKSIEYALPPRSLYTDLPRRFRFERVEEMPLFLRETVAARLKAIEKTAPLSIWRLDLGAISANVADFCAREVA